MLTRVAALVVIGATAPLLPRAADGQADQQGAKARQTLTIGRAERRQLTAPAVDRWTLPLGGDQVAVVTVLQKGIDVVIKVIDPAGAVRASVDAPNGAFGFERAMWVTDSAGEWTIQVEPFESETSGVYEILWRSVAPGSASRRQAVKASDSAKVLSAAASSAFEDGVAVSLRRAAELWTAAAAMARAAADPFVEATALNGIGAAQSRLGKQDSALVSIRRVLKLVRQNGDSAAEGSALERIGTIHWALGRPDSARMYYNQALAIQRALGAHDAAAVTQRYATALAKVLSERASAPAAVEGPKPGAAMNPRQLDDSAAAVMRRFAEGRQGAIEQAEERVRELLARAAAAQAEPGGVGKAAGFVGLAAEEYRKAGKLDSALALATRAREMFATAGETLFVGLMFLTSAQVHQRSVRLDSAIAHCRLGLAALGPSADPGLVVRFREELGLALLRAGHADSAIQQLERAAQIRAVQEELSAEHDVRLLLAAAYLASNDRSLALAQFDTLLALARRMPGGDALRDRTGAEYAARSLRAQGLRISVDGAADVDGWSARLMAWAGGAYRLVGDSAEAARHLGFASVALSSVTGFVGGSYTDSALAYARTALELVPTRAAEMRAWLFTVTARVHANMPSTDSARDYYGRAITTARGAKNAAIRLQALSGLADLYADAGDLDSARVALHTAIATARAERLPSNEASILSSLAGIELELGRVDTAVALYQRVVEFHRRRGNPGATASALMNLARARAREDPRRALEEAREAAVLIRRDETPAPTALGAVSRLMGGIYSALDLPDSALAYYGHSLSLARAVGNVRWMSSVLNGMGTTLGRLGLGDSAITVLRQALEAARAGQNPTGEAAALANLADALHTVLVPPKLPQAVAYYDSAMALQSDQAGRLGRDEDFVSLAERRAATAEGWALAWLGRSEEIGPEMAALASLAALERGRAQALLRLMRGKGARDPAGRDLPAEGAALVRTLPPRTAALTYLVTLDSIVTWLVLPGGRVEVARSPVAFRALAALVLEWRAELGGEAGAERRLAARGIPLETGPQADRGIGVRAGGVRPDRMGQAVSRLVLPAPLLARLGGIDELLIVPTGLIALVPFAALPTGDTDGRLGARYAVRYAPSLAAVAAAEARNPTPIDGARTLIVGNPSMPSVTAASGKRVVLSPLAGAQSEGQSIARRLGASSLTGESATEALVRARLPRAGIVHLATHGYAYASERRSRHSFVALAPGAGHDGLLTVGEVLDDPALVLMAELVALSACQTGLGDIKDAEGTIGLQRAFLARGARSVLVSLWNVSDEATQLLMERFYGHWLDDPDKPTKAEALRRAQNDVRATKGYEHPRYWAAFQLVGAR